MGFATRPVPLVFAVLGTLLAVAMLIDAMLVISLYAYSKDGASWSCQVNGQTQTGSDAQIRGRY